MTSETQNKGYYISLISQKSDRYGDLLLELMDKHNVNGLQQITLEQAKEFYESLEVKESD